MNLYCNIRISQNPFSNRREQLCFGRGLVTRTSRQGSSGSLCISNIKLQWSELFDQLLDTAISEFHKTLLLNNTREQIYFVLVLLQGPAGKDLPAAYAPRILNYSEVNYSITEKELLAILWALKYFRPYLFGTKFSIMSNNKPFQWLFSLKDQNSHQRRCPFEDLKGLWLYGRIHRKLRETNSQLKQCFNYCEHRSRTNSYWLQQWHITLWTGAISLSWTWNCSGTWIIWRWHHTHEVFVSSSISPSPLNWTKSNYYS